MKKTWFRFFAALLVLLLCLPILPLSAVAEGEPVADSVLEFKADSPTAYWSDLTDLFGDSILSSASYALEAKDDSATFKEIGMLSSYSFPAPGLYTAYKTTVKTGSILNKKPDWTQATTKLVEVKLYYTADCSVVGANDGALYLNDEATEGEVKLYVGSEYAFTAKALDEYEYILTGAEEGAVFEASSDLTVSLTYTKLASATVNLTVGEGGSATILSGGLPVTNGKVSEGEGFFVEVVPDTKNGYYLDSIVIEKDGVLCEGASVESVLNGEQYEITVSFAQAAAELPENLEVNYIDIEKGQYDRIEEAILSQLSFVPEAFSDGATYEVKFVTGMEISGKYHYEALDYEVPLTHMLSRHKFGESQVGERLAIGNTEKIKVICKNEDFPGLELVATSTVTVIDQRIPTEIASTKTIKITYGDDLKTELLKVLCVTGENGEVVDFDADQIDVTPEVPDVKLFQSQEVQVFFRGNEDYAASAGTASVYVRQANASLSVKSQTIAYGTIPSIEVVTDPDKLEYILAIAGIDGEAQGFISIYLPKNVQDLMKIGGMLDLYELLRSAMQDGMTFAELRAQIDLIASIVNADGMDAIAASMDFDLESVRTVLNLLAELPEIDINAKITLGNPPRNAGLYFVGAVSANLNYKLSTGIAYLTILPKTDTPEEPVTLHFTNEIGEDRPLSYNEAQTFGFGGFLQVGEEQIDTTHVKATYSGVTFGGDVIPLSETPIRLPGVYVETIFALGGNYLPEPIIRVYAVERVSVAINAEDASVFYKGLPCKFEFSLSEEGIDPNDVAVFYEIDGCLSCIAPTAVGTYPVTLIYFGDGIYEGAQASATLTIKKASVTVDLYSAGSVLYEAVGKSNISAAGLGASVTGLPFGEELDVTPYIVETENFPHVGSYRVDAVVASNDNYDVHVNGTTLTILPRPVEIVMRDATKYYGEQDPQLSYWIKDFDADTEALSDHERKDARIAGITPEIDSQSDDGHRYAIVAKIGAKGASDDYEILAVKSGVFTILPREATVTIDSASKVFGDEDPEWTGSVEGLLEGDDLLLNFTREPGEGVGEYAISAIADHENYHVTFVGEGGKTGVFRITPKTIFVKVSDLTKDQGEADPAFALTVQDESGRFLDPKELGLVISREEGEEAGTYQIKVSLSGADYRIDTESYQGGELTIKSAKPAPTTDKTPTKETEAAKNGNALLWALLSAAAVVLLVFAGVLIFKKKKAKK